MPLERVVEFKIAGNVDTLPELIYFIGKASVAMFEDRPERLPRPRDPSVAQRLKRLEELLNPLLQYLQPQQVKLPLETLERQLEDAIKKLEALHRDVSYNVRLAEELRTKLALSRDVAPIKTAAVPKTETLDVFVALPGRALKEALELARSQGATVVQQGNALLIAVERKNVKQLKTALEKLGARVLTLQEVADIEPPSAIEEKIKRVEEELNSTIVKHQDLLNYAYTLRETAAKVLDVYFRSAVDEGAEMKHLFESHEREIKKLEEQLATLRKIGKVLEGLQASSLKLPEGYKLYVDPEMPIEAPHMIQEINGMKVALVRGEARGVEIPQEYLQDVRTGIELVKKAEESTNAALQRIKRELESLEKLYQEFSLYGDKRWEEHADTASVTFYVLEKDVGKLDEALAEFIKRNVGKLDIVRRLRYKYLRDVPVERRPTVERYPAPIRQFTKIVYMYGVPRADELSPAPLVALLFPVFFGWMYGDLGHGFLLFLLGVLLMTKLYGGRHRDWGVIWALTGLSSMFFGAFVYQEVFGFGLKELGIKMPTLPLLHLFGVHTLVESEGVIVAMRAAFLLGFLLVLLAFLSKVVNTVLRGEPDVAVGIVLPQALIFLSLGMVFFSLIKEAFHMEFLAPLLQLPWMYIFLVAFIWSAAGMLILRARYKHHEEAPPLTEEFIMGFVEGSLAALANIPSFSRLVILILIHGVLTKLANGVAIALGPAGILFAVFAHALIAAGEGLFSTVQSLRLTFYEIFSKFYEGRGRLFTPLALP
ncbi:V-type ATPase 116kDa subunit family protein [Pyrobaculum neutrophilum]|uniref:A-type ATP synthase subunit I n=1 Tax=Pyrobaculum neutrophilum (strain DSM 2338 / JCM 9278 / NBRC 100436 / V24Sta) TaxID=444157 RepID=B1YD19_PYRNV|nr:V-type ATPase 116kDa subunit family protein [Pyrobaculum neutrophilum]ACB39682.1 V-type ATPase 116 kDa subunit [Pyrobaculum neutrophilum V24Sta]